MGWTKSIKRTDNGATASYWTLVSMTYTAKTGSTSLALAGWLDKASHDAGLQAISQKNYMIPANASPVLAAAVSSFAQDYALAQPDFAAAVLDVVTPPKA